MSLLDERLQSGCDLDEFLGLFKDHVEGDPFRLGHRLDNYWFEAACHSDNLEVAQWLYKNSGFRLKLNGIKHYESSCALVSAMQGSAYKSLRWLLTLKNLDVNIKVSTGLLLDSYDGSALDYAIRQKFPEDIIITFIQRGTTGVSHENLIMSQLRRGNTPTTFNIISQLLLHGGNCREEDDNITSYYMGHHMHCTKTAYDIACFHFRKLKNKIILGEKNACSLIEGNKCRLALKHWETTMYIYCFKEAGIELDTETLSILSSFCEQIEFEWNQGSTHISMIPVDFLKDDEQEDLGYDAEEEEDEEDDEDDEEEDEEDEENQ
jgi:hypothetical protein